MGTCDPGTRRTRAGAAPGEHHGAALGRAAACRSPAWCPRGSHHMEAQQQQQQQQRGARSRGRGSSTGSSSCCRAALYMVAAATVGCIPGQAYAYIRNNNSAIALQSMNDSQSLPDSLATCCWTRPSPACSRSSDGCSSSVTQPSCAIFVLWLSGWRLGVRAEQCHTVLQPSPRLLLQQGTGAWMAWRRCCWRCSSWASWASPRR